jgi:hypothetical protein
MKRLIDMSSTLCLYMYAVRFSTTKSLREISSWSISQQVKGKYEKINEYCLWHVAIQEVMAIK